MNLLSLMFLINWSAVQEPKIKKLDNADQIEMLNAIDIFKQYHTNSFKVNLFRRVSSENRESSGYQLANYVIGILNYSELDMPSLYEIGDFYSPQIINATRQPDELIITIEHGTSEAKQTFTLTITKNGVKSK